MNLLTPQQLDEFIHCKEDFLYFAKTYVKILDADSEGSGTPKLVPFILYGFQERVIQDYEIYSQNIVSKFRQGGLTTVSVIWALWRCLFKTDQVIMVMSKSDREAVNISKKVRDAKDGLPLWMRPTLKNGGMRIDNDHEKEFAETGSVLSFHTSKAARSRSLTHLIIDEAAFIPNMADEWAAMYPTLATGGRCIVISTPNGIGNWYEETYMKAKDKKNTFHPIDLNYKEHPKYRKPEFEEKMKANLGLRKWSQEFLCDFLGAGETYIESALIKEYERKCEDPIRKLYPEWDQRPEDIFDDLDLPNSHYEPGAMHIWEEPRLGHEYIIAADAAEGVGDEGDNNAFHILDAATLTQVAEFYSNIVPPHKFAVVLKETATYYNGAQVIVENTMGPGLAVCNHLENTLAYDNIYYTQTGKREKAGVKLNKNERPVYLESLQTCMMNKIVKIKSYRFIKELKTFIWNKQKQRAEAQKGKHDDLVISLAIALFVTNAQERQAPIGAIASNTIFADIFKNESFENIKKELEKGITDDMFGEEQTEELAELLPKLIKPRHRRPFDKLLKSFDW